MRAPILVSVLLGFAGAACANAMSTTDDPAPGNSTPAADSGTSQKDGGAIAKDAGTGMDASTTDDGSTAVDSGPPPTVVYGHTSDTLFAFDVGSKMVTTIGKFSGCSQNQFPIQVIDLAVDENGKAFVTTFDGFYSLDLTTAACTPLAKGSYTYPNSLSFVAKGTVDQNAEALVGYNGSTYVRIDTSSGAITNIGMLSMGYASSGDVVSVKGGGTFLTVTGNGCSDCLLQVDPKNGNVIQNYGSVSRGAVYGLAYWAGALYGFDEGGDLFMITGGDGGTASTTDVMTDGGVKWWGAGSTTSAPLKDADGGAIPTQ